MSRWLRRAATVSGVFVALALSAALLPPLLPLLWLVDRLRGTALCRTACFALVLLLCEAGGILACLAIWLRAGLGRRRARFLHDNARLQAWWGSTLYRLGERIFSVRTVIEGEVPAPGSGPLLCFSRHASTADTVLPVVLLGLPGFRLRYVLKRELLLGPCLDIVGHRLPNCFVRRGVGSTDQEVQRVLSLWSEEGGVGPGDALVVYPEGTRFSEKKRKDMIARIEHSESGTELARLLAPALRHTLSPLRQGALSLLRANPGADLLVLAHAGLESAATLGDLVSGRLVGQTVRVRLVRVPFAQIPADGDGQAQLLARLWREVDEFVALFTPRRRSGT